MIVGLAGAKRSGKDTVARIMREEFHFKRLAFADAIKEVLLAIDPIVLPSGVRVSEIIEHIGWELAKDSFPEIRRLMQRTGFEAIRTYDDNFWINVVMNQITSDSKVVITDVRFPNEVEAIQQRGGIVYRVRRDSAEREQDLHASETALSDVELLEVPNNGSLDELRIVVEGLFGETVSD